MLRSVSDVVGIRKGIGPKLLYCFRKTFLPFAAIDDGVNTASLFKLSFRYILLVIIFQRHSDFRLGIRVSVSDHILKVCEHDVLQTACGNFINFAP